MELVHVVFQELGSFSVKEDRFLVGLLSEQLLPALATLHLFLTPFLCMPKLMEHALELGLELTPITHRL